MYIYLNARATGNIFVLISLHILKLQYFSLLITLYFNIYCKSILYSKCKIFFFHLGIISHIQPESNFGPTFKPAKVYIFPFSPL